MAQNFSLGILKKAERWAILTVAVTVGLSIVATLWASGSSLAQNIAAIPWHSVWLLALATIIQNLLRFARYEVAARALHLNVPWYRHLYYFCVGFALIPTPGKVGMAIRLWLLRQYHGLPYRRTAPLMVMDLVSDAIAMLALISVSLLVIQDARLHTIGILCGIALVVGVAMVFITPTFMLVMLKLLYALSGKRKPRLFAKVLGMVRTTSRIFGPRIMSITIGLSVLAWGIYGAAVACLLQNFGFPDFSIPHGILAINLSNIGGFLSMMPAGIGGAEASLAGIFTLASIPLGTTVIATILIRLTDVWMPVLIGFLLLPIAIRNAPRTK